MRVFLRTLTMAVASWAVSSSAATHFVDLNGINPFPPYTDWSTAATNIQDAINSAGVNDVVLVTNGVYQYGGDSFNGSNRVDVAAGVTLQSVNGPAVTIIQGYQIAGTTNGPAAVRCAYVREFGKLFGFTLAGGATVSSSSDGSLNGGGLATDTQCVISNCIIRGNASHSDGGGAYLGGGTTLFNCIVNGNVALVVGARGGGVCSSGSGASRAALVNCVVSSNIATFGGGLYACQAFNSLLVGNGWTNDVTGTQGGAANLSALYNCTAVGNISRLQGACSGCAVVNSIIYYNLNNLTYADTFQCFLTNSCTTIGLGTPTLPNNCFSNAPGFLNFSAGDYHLNPLSRCVNAGNSALVTNSVDLEGNPRIVGAAVDVGAYENQSPFQGLAHYVSLLSTNPVSPYTSWSTAATNLQAGVNAAQAGELVIADDGIYTNSGIVMFGAETNRVVLTNGATLASAGGPRAAIISGGTQTRCVYVGSNSILNGFTLTGGRGLTFGNVTNEQSGLGAWCEIGGVVSNCLVLGNVSTSASLGGGIFRGSVYDSTIVSNGASIGAAAAQGTYFNCLFASNAVTPGSLGGGIYRGTASNCTFIANGLASGVTGGAAYGSTLYNCTLLTNSSSAGGGGADSSALYHCTLIGNQSTSGGGGTHASTNYNCVFFGNFATNGGAVNAGMCSGCLLSNNIATFGGGSYQASLTNCTVFGNQATNGGGAYFGNLFNSLIVSNSTTGTGGGIYDASGVYNCTLIGNNALHSGGSFESKLYNSIVYYNTATTDSNYTFTTTLSFCCTAPLSASTANCFTNEPLFVNLAGGDLHLQSNSSCINSGYNNYVTGGPGKLTTDFDGNPRIVSTAVDVGAYEFQSPASVLPYSWLWQYGLATDGSADFADADGDGMSNYAEWRAATDPTDASSALILQAPVLAETNTTITWPSVAGLNYYLQSTPNLSAQPFTSIASNIVGSAGTTSYTDTNVVSGASSFYRVGVQ